MKHTILILAAIALFAIDSAIAQQDAHYTQYMYNMNIINPAYAGSKNNLTAGVLGRTQWVGIDDAPQTITASAHTPVNNKFGAGVSAIADTYGPVREQDVYADFSYTIELDGDKNIAFGLKGGASFLNVNILSLRANDETEKNNTTLENIDRVYPNFGAGVYFYTNTYYLGASTPNILESRHYTDADGVISTASEDLHVFLTGGYVFQLTDNVKLKPSLLSKVVFGAPLSVDFSANALYKNNFELGMSYRWDDSISAMAGVYLSNEIRVGYAYDYTLTNLGNFNSGSHEVFLLIDILREDSRSPRFF